MSQLCFVSPFSGTSSTVITHRSPLLSTSVRRPQPPSTYVLNPTCTARSSSRKPRRNSRSRPKRPPSKKSFGVSSDPLLNDNDIDTTDITTFVSCPVCFNSLMLRPQQLVKQPLTVRCNCCGTTTEARLEELEGIDGDFDYKQWLIEYNSHQMSDEDIEQLQQFAT